IDNAGRRLSATSRVTKASSACAVASYDLTGGMIGSAEASAGALSSPASARIEPSNVRNVPTRCMSFSWVEDARDESRKAGATIYQAGFASQANPALANGNRDRHPHPVSPFPGTLQDMG